MTHGEIRFASDLERDLRRSLALGTLRAARDDLAQLEHARLRAWEAYDRAQLAWLAADAAVRDAEHVVARLERGVVVS